MFSVKISNKVDRTEVGRTIKNLVKYVSEKINLVNTKIISDNTSVEMISGKEPLPDENAVVVELLIRKNIVIHPDEFDNKEKLDEYILKIKHFCDQAKNIEDLKYIPINMRK